MTDPASIGTLMNELRNLDDYIYLCRQNLHAADHAISELRRLREEHPYSTVLDLLANDAKSRSNDCRQTVTDAQQARRRLTRRIKDHKKKDSAA